MSNELRENIRQMKEIIRELNMFSNQFESISNIESDNIKLDAMEKKLLEDTIVSLTNQLRILNKSFPKLIDKIGIYRGLSDSTEVKKSQTGLTKVKYKPSQEKQEVSLVISDEDKSEFLEKYKVKYLK